VKNIYLASRSPRRRELLKQIGIAFQVVQLREDSRRGADVDETPNKDEAPADYALRIARAKAELAVHYLQRRSQQRWPVLAADTTVALEGAILGKPADRKEAAEMLAQLSGQRHEVLTAVALMRDDELDSALSRSEVLFKKLSSEEIAQYVASGDCDDKAGAYAIQGRAARFVIELRGSYSGVMGLPLYETSQLLEKLRDRRNPY